MLTCKYLHIDSASKLCIQSPIVVGAEPVHKPGMGSQVNNRWDSVA